MHIAFGTAVTVIRNSIIRNYKGTYNQVLNKNIIDGMPNPMVEYPTVEDATIQVGHLCPLPSIYERYSKKAYVISNTMIQIDYYDDEGRILTLREEARPSGDISGVYTEYAYTGTAQIAGNEVTLKGDSADFIYVATWNDGAYSHSLTYENGAYLEEVTRAIEDINA